MNPLPPWITIASILYCLWGSRSLMQAWTDSPLESYGWIPFIIWLIPAFKGWSARISEPQKTCLFTALAITCLGSLASVNTIKYIGLAVAFASLVPWSWISLAWICSSLSWMPALSWQIVHWFPAATARNILAVKIFLSIFGVGLMVWKGVKKNED